METFALFGIVEEVLFRERVIVAVACQRGGGSNKRNETKRKGVVHRYKVLTSIAFQES